jgi:hypothetical protein
MNNAPTTARPPAARNHAQLMRQLLDAPDRRAAFAAIDNRLFALPNSAIDKLDAIAAELHP